MAPRQPSLFGEDLPATGSDDSLVAVGSPPRRRQAEETLDAPATQRGAPPRVRRDAQGRHHGLYRRLVKALHPDLEPEPQVRARKSALMQDVTSAYARNDFHALIRIELGWFDRESTATTGLSDETLSAYLDLLKEQAAQLEDEYAALPFHPRYEPLLADEGPLGLPVLVDGPAEVDRLDMVIVRLRHGIEHLAGADALTHVRGAIREYRQARQQDRIERPRRKRRRKRRRHR